MIHTMKKLLILVLIGSTLMHCNTKSDNTDHDIADHNPISKEHVMGDHRTVEIMAIHDSIMPKMEDIMNLKSELKLEITRLDSLLEKEKNTQLSARKTKAEDLASILEKADKDMMGWMHQYNADSLSKLKEEEANSYIRLQTEKINSVKQSMLGAINDAVLFLSDKK